MQIHPPHRFFRANAALAGVLLSALCAAQPALAADDTFSYADGALEGQGTAGDWAGAWTAGAQSAPPIGTTPFQVQSGALSVNPVDPTIPFGYTESDVQRTLTTPATGTSVYMSLLITPGDMGVTYDPLLFSNGSTGAVVGFADSDLNIGTDGPTITTFRFYEGFSGLYTDGFGISLNGVYSSSNTIIGSWVENQTYRLVGRLTFDAQGGQEQWSVWIDPVVETDVPAGSVTKSLAYSSIGMTSLYQYVDNFTAVGSSFIDDLRIGTSWDSVTGPITLQGDLNGDGFVGLDDLDIVLQNWNLTVPPGDVAADPSGDGFVGLDDLDTVLNNWNAGTPPGGGHAIPEPSGLCVLITLGLWTIRSRRI